MAGVPQPVQEDHCGRVLQPITFTQNCIEAKAGEDCTQYVGAGRGGAGRSAAHLGRGRDDHRVRHVGEVVRGCLSSVSSESGELSSHACGEAGQPAGTGQQSCWLSAAATASNTAAPLHSHTHSQLTSHCGASSRREDQLLSSRPSPTHCTFWPTNQSMTLLFIEGPFPLIQFYTIFSIVDIIVRRLIVFILILRLVKDNLIGKGGKGKQFSCFFG